MLRGVDCSDWQPGIDWAAVVGGGYTFAVIKATEGGGNVQETFAANRRDAPAAGIGPLGLYHFARPESGEPEAQADHFCDVVRSVGADEFVVLDVETGDQSTWPDFILRWFARVESRLGSVPVCVYLSDDPAARMTAEVGRIPLWDAAYGSNMGNVPNWGTGHDDQYHGQFEYSWNVGPWDTWTIWQHSSKGNVPGIDGLVDVNIAPDDLRARLGIGAAPRPRPPAHEPPTPLVPGLEHEHPTFADRVSRLCDATGATVYSGARSTEEQKRLYDGWKAGLPGYNPANPPGSSWHEYGDITGGSYAVAVDLDVPNEDFGPVHDRAAEFGLCFPVASEAWHCQPAEITETSRVPGAEDRIPALPQPPDPPEEEDMAGLYVYDYDGHTWLTEGFFRRVTNDPFVYLNAGAKHLGDFDAGQHGELWDRDILAVKAKPRAKTVS